MGLSGQFLAVFTQNLSFALAREAAFNPGPVQQLATFFVLATGKSLRFPGMS